jgi:hypothetical protein
MKTDSTDTRQRKARERRRLEAVGVTLPEWLIEGIYAGELQRWAQDAEAASERFRGSMGGSLCRDTRG